MLDSLKQAENSLTSYANLLDQHQASTWISHPQFSIDTRLALALDTYKNQWSVQLQVCGQ